MSKKQDILEKYLKVNLKKKKSFQRLIDSDVSPTSKYSDYMCKLWSNRCGLDGFTLPQIVKLVRNFDSHLDYLKNKDIYSKDYSDFFNAKQLVDEAVYQKNCKTFVRKGNVKVILEDGEYFLTKILTLKGAQKYGTGTKWCISGTNTYKDYEMYSKGVQIYFLIRKKEKKTQYDKLAFLINNTKNIKNIQIYLSDDSSITKSKLIKTSDWEKEHLSSIIEMIINDVKKL